MVGRVVIDLTTTTTTVAVVDIVTLIVVVVVDIVVDRMRSCLVYGYSPTSIIIINTTTINR